MASARCDLPEKASEFRFFRRGAWALLLVVVGCGGRQASPRPWGAGGAGGSGAAMGGSGGGAASAAGGAAGTRSDPTGSAGAGGGGEGGNDADGYAVLRYDGSVSIVNARVEISAPIVPRTKVIYQAFPETLAGERTMAHDAALLFDWLVEKCAPLYPNITLDEMGTGLTDEQLAVNYAEVGRCAYEQYSAKPYWIPKLVGDVDICGAEMGPGWRLISEEDIASLTPADLAAVADKWNHPGRCGGLSFYFTSLDVWVRGLDGTIKQGTLSVGGGPTRVQPLSVDATSTQHYEAGLALRCIRQSSGPGDDRGGGAGTGGRGGSGGSPGGTVGCGSVGGGDGGTPDSSTTPTMVCDGFTIPADRPNASRDYDVSSAAGVVVDAVTGLMWERSATAGLGGGFFESNCSQRLTGGLTGWRRPTLLELASLVDFSVHDPAINAGAFPGTASAFFATSTGIYQYGRQIGSESYGWSVDFRNGLILNGLPNDFYFRCVREPAPLRCYETGRRFEASSQSTVAAVHDAATGLIWQRSVPVGAKTWLQAKAYCDGLGDGYRLPGVKESLSLLDSKTVSQPAIDLSAFPDTPQGAFWTATHTAENTSKAIAVDFTYSVNARAIPTDDTELNFVRCVR